MRPRRDLGRRRPRGEVGRRIAAVGGRRRRAAGFRRGGQDLAFGSGVGIFPVFFYGEGGIIEQWPGRSDRL
jgi:hypothetical protein